MKKTLGLSLICALAFSAIFTMCNNPEPAEQTHEVIEQSVPQEVQEENIAAEPDSTSSPQDSVAK